MGMIEMEASESRQEFSTVGEKNGEESMVDGKWCD